ncbi:MAG: PaaX family transcriptional regulator [Solirubrobacteraceae bacterium]
MRSPITPQPQHLLLTLLGDFWYRREEALPSTALVELLAECGVSNSGARAAIARLARRGMLELVREGRRTSYRLTAKGSAVLLEGTRRIFAFGTRALPWDGSWTVVAFSLPEARRDRRHVLRVRLRWLGFAGLYDALWVAPGDHRAAAEALLEELAVTTATVVLGPASGPPGGNPMRAWDPADLRRHYERFIADFAPLGERVAAGAVGSVEALAARTSAIDVWRTFPGQDPELPEPLLPAGWPRRAARDLFVEIYDTLGPPATARFREILAAHAPELAPLAEHHSALQGATLEAAAAV